MAYLAFYMPKTLWSITHFVLAAVKGFLHEQKIELW